MSEERPPPSARQSQLLEAAYQYALEHGLVDLSLRPLATAIGSSPRVLLYLFGSKDALIRALLARARVDELEMLDRLRQFNDEHLLGLEATAEHLWSWLSVDAHRPLLTLWVEGYARSLVEPDGPWAGFARSTVADWLALFAASQLPRERDHAAGEAKRTAVLAVLRGGLLDLLATAETARTSTGVRLQLRALRQQPPESDLPPR